MNIKQIPGYDEVKKEIIALIEQRVKPLEVRIVELEKKVAELSPGKGQAA